MTTLEVRPALPESLRDDAGKLIYAAFEAKWRLLAGRSPQRLVALLSHALDPHQVLAAVEDGQLLGLAGLGHGGRPCLSASLRQCLAHLGLRGVPAWPILRQLRGRYPPDELHIDFLAVDEAQRGRGIGTRLLEAAAARARQLELVAMRLEVVDTNTSARRLYERQGYVVIAEHKIPFVPRSMGFTAEVIMRRPL
jgi:ribosomal protein S18 acetylase RimI-like enzyme